MKHFDKIKWLEYKNNKLEEKEEIEMENHLYSCDSCMEIFLSTIGDEEVQIAEDYIPVNFTENIMASIKNVKPMVKPKKKKKVINDFFLYYAAVASVAIVLTAGGFFGNMVDSVPKIGISIENSKNQIRADSVFNLSETITNKTSDFINNFGTNKIKED